MTSNEFQNIARAVSGYADQVRTDAVKISGTALMGNDARINVNSEDYYGSIRWNTTLGDIAYGTTAGTPGSTSNVNIATQDETEGNTTEHGTDISEYIKTARNAGADEYNVTQIITQQPGAIAAVGGQFGDIRARDEDRSVVDVLKGVISSEVHLAKANGEAGQTDPDNLDDASGFFFDTNGAKGANDVAGSNPLFDSSKSGAASAEALWAATAAGYSDLEPEFFYLIVQPSVYQEMRSANLISEDRVTDGNVQFASLMGGMFRVIVSRTGLGSYNGIGTLGATQAVNAGSDKTSLICLPGSLSMVDLAQPTPVEFDADASKGTGSGKREAWYRWGYVMHPRGYTWAGSKSGFATNEDTTASVTLQSNLTGYNYNPSTASQKKISPWTRKETVGNLGILPVFHS
jgi:hypothetical protein